MSIPTDLFDLSGKVAVITGSSKGIGRSMALAMADHGAKVVISSRKAPACEAVVDEINGASDNPVVLLETGEVVSSGGYLTPHLAVVLNMTAQALVHLAAAQVARMARMISPRFTELPVGLVAGDTGTAGMAPASKTSEALFSEIVHLAQPAPVYPSGAADGVEDVISHSAVPARALLDICDRLSRLNAMELMIATQAVELRDPADVAPHVRRNMTTVREHVQHMTADRAMSADIEALAEVIESGVFSQI